MSRNVISTVVVFLFSMVLAACSSIDLLNSMVPNQGFKRISDLTYAQGARGGLDIYQPKTPLAGNPVIVFVYGGSWQEGNRTDYRFVGQALANKGMTVVIADYRVAPEVGYPAFLEDTAQALVWTYHHISTYGGNPDNLFIAGHSAGAYNALMVATNNVYLKQVGGQGISLRGVIGLAGPYNFLPIEDPKIIAIFGGAARPETQPITYVKNGLPPMLLMHGTDDDKVYMHNTRTMARALAEHGNEVEMHLYPQVGHVGIVLALAHPFQWRTPVLAQITDFVKRHSLRAVVPNHKGKGRK